MSYLSVTDADREAMLGAIGVPSIDQLFEQIPEAVRLGRELDLEPALSEQGLVEHLSELAARNVDTTREISFLGAGIYDHYVPAVVDAMLARGEFLTAYTPYQPEMSQGVLQAIFEYQTVICELTGMDVSNASGYDGTTVADELAAASDGAAAAIFQQPNFFGVLEPAPDLATAANDAGALPVAHVDPVSLGVLEAPGNYGCALAIGEGQPAGNYLSYGGPHYGFIAAPSEFIPRMPGRIVGETTDTDGERGYVLTLQTREQHIRREKATSNITTNQTLLALCGLMYLSWLGPQGLREVGETCLALSEHAKQRLTAAGYELVFPERATFREFAVRVGRNAKEAVAAARALGVHPG